MRVTRGPPIPSAAQGTKLTDTECYRKSRDAPGEACTKAPEPKDGGRFRVVPSCPQARRTIWGIESNRVSQRTLQQDLGWPTLQPFGSRPSRGGKPASKVPLRLFALWLLVRCCPGADHELACQPTWDDIERHVLDVVRHQDTLMRKA
ncbi:hypothetical protein CABS01_08185 [Colletotrichum abscissum]|uniref:uncharacterized protein n=1 Tax=Colletotrichum abscissum TaxID=1671311 RepID=UPI0027D50A8B|nr:uncharacterized protein CABS01_08185 [Colletotrichum abscissum]KAK1508955.1 hypothetical protein CABS01_08185 [Colletotrichum abscissum]